MIHKFISAKKRGKKPTDKKNEASAQEPEADSQEREEEKEVVEEQAKKNAKTKKQASEKLEPDTKATASKQEENVEVESRHFFSFVRQLWTIYKLKFLSEKAWTKTN